MRMLNGKKKCNPAGDSNVVKRQQSYLRSTKKNQLEAQFS